MTPAVFLDRDGTLNVEKNYLHRYEEWEWLPGAIDAIRALNALGLMVVVVTNQAGIARGYYTEEDVGYLHRRIDEDLVVLGARIDAYYYCPHHPDFGPGAQCDCRKPAPGLILRASREMGLDLGQSFMIGDNLTDIQAGAAAGVRSILVTTGYGNEYRWLADEGVPVFEALLPAVKFIERTMTERSKTNR